MEMALEEFIKRKSLIASPYDVYHYNHSSWAYDSDLNGNDHAVLDVVTNDEY